jgi:hypothetical protein
MIEGRIAEFPYAGEALIVTKEEGGKYYITGRENE